MVMVRFTCRVAGAACAAFVLSASAQDRTERVDSGQRDFEANCASCHGPAGKGDGPVAPFLTIRPADLTQLAKKNGGLLPVARMYEVIEGADVAAHGSREMPVWGVEFRTQPAEHRGDIRYNSEANVRARIVALIEYIDRLQNKQGN